MKHLLVLILVTYLETLSSCKSKQTDNKQNTQSSISQAMDTSKQKVIQKIEGGTIEFNYSDFRDLKSNKHYDRFFAGNLILTTGQVVCTDPMYRELGLPQTWTVKP